MQKKAPVVPADNNKTTVRQFVIRLTNFLTAPPNTWVVSEDDLIQDHGYVGPIDKLVMMVSVSDDAKSKPFEQHWVRSMSHPFDVKTDKALSDGLISLRYAQAIEQDTVMKSGKTCTTYTELKKLFAEKVNAGSEPAAKDAGSTDRFKEVPEPGITMSTKPLPLALNPRNFYNQVLKLSGEQPMRTVIVEAACNWYHCFQDCGFVGTVRDLRAMLEKEGLSGSDYQPVLEISSEPGQLLWLKHNGETVMRDPTPEETAMIEKVKPMTCFQLYQCMQVQGSPGYKGVRGWPGTQNNQTKPNSIIDSLKRLERAADENGAQATKLKNAAREVMYKLWTIIDRVRNFKPGDFEIRFSPLQDSKTRLKQTVIVRSGTNQDYPEQDDFAYIDSVYFFATQTEEQKAPCYTYKYNDNGIPVSLVLKSPEAWYMSKAGHPVNLLAPAEQLTKYDALVVAEMVSQGLLDKVARWVADNTRDSKTDLQALSVLEDALGKLKQI